MKSELGNIVRITIASSHREERVNRFAPTGYAFTLSTSLAKPHWGYGAAKEAQEMMAQGLNRAAESAFIHDQDAAIEVIVRTVGIEKYLKEFLPEWLPMMSSPGFARNNIEVWKRLHELYSLGSLIIRTPNPAEKRLVEEMQMLALESAMSALVDLHGNRTRYGSAGVFATDEDEPSLRTA